MKLIEKKAYNYAYNGTDLCDEHTGECLVNAYEAGFRAARELAAKEKEVELDQAIIRAIEAWTCDDLSLFDAGTKSRIEGMLKLGENEVSE